MEFIQGKTPPGLAALGSREVPALYHLVLLRHGQSERNAAGLSYNAGLGAKVPGEQPARLLLAVLYWHSVENARYVRIH